MGRETLRFTVRYERDDDGWWVASIPKLPGCHTQGRTIEQARERIREALALVIGDVAAERAQLHDDVELAAPLRRMIERVAATRLAADEKAELATSATREAVKKLTAVGLSARDAGELLGLSRQRVNQIIHGRR